MASGYSIRIFNAPITTNATTLGSVFTLPLGSTDIFYAHTVTGRIDGTFTATLAYSQDGIFFVNFTASGPISSNATILRALTGPFFSYVRIQIVSGSVTSGATNSIILAYDMRF